MSDRGDAQRLLRELLSELLEGVLPDADAATGNVRGRHANENGRANGNHADENGRANGNGRRDAGHDERRDQPGHEQRSTPIPSVPAPPVAAVLRPSTWSQPPAPGEVVGNGRAPAASTPDNTGHRPSPQTVTPVAAPGSPGGRGAGPSAPASSGPPAPAPPSASAAVAPARAPASAAPAGARREWVTLDSDEDLDRFVRSLVTRFENPRDRMAIRAGRLRFALRRAAGAAGPGGGGLSVESGAVTERTVNEAAAAGARLVLGPRAVLTPLARERARTLGVQIEREPRC